MQPNFWLSRPAAVCWLRGIATGGAATRLGGRFPMQKHERKAKRMIEKAGFRMPSDAMLTAGSI
jgi:hypothetical protein